MTVPSPAKHAPEISFVVPVYRGADTIRELVDEIKQVALRAQLSVEVILVWDGGDSASRTVVGHLADQNQEVAAVLLTRNYGQHAATIAGICASKGAWVVTLDEDGMHDPSLALPMIKAAKEQGLDIVYGRPLAVPHSKFRNTTSVAAKRFVRRISSLEGTGSYGSFRVLRGCIVRKAVRDLHYGVYLDVALGWVTSDVGVHDVEYRQEGRRSSYNLRALLQHFNRLFLSSGTKPLRWVTGFGLLAMAIAVVALVVLSISVLLGNDFPHGWASLVVAQLFFGGATLGTLGLLAEYVGLVVLLAAGRPLFVTREQVATSETESDESCPAE